MSISILFIRIHFVGYIWTENFTSYQHPLLKKKITPKGRLLQTIYGKWFDKKAKMKIEQNWWGATNHPSDYLGFWLGQSQVESAVPEQV